MFAISKSKPPSLVTSYIGIATSRNQVRLYNVLHDTSIPDQKRKHIPSSGTYPKGFRVSGTHVGVKASNTKFPDLALISSDEPCNAAAVFTTNKFQAAPVQVSKTTLSARQGKGVQSVVINSGCANAVTGKGGLEDAQSMGATVDKCAGLSEPSTIVMSTGVIGQRYETPNPFFHCINCIGFDRETPITDSPSPKSSTKSPQHTPTLPARTMPG